jgi:hypothetical protein
MADIQQVIDAAKKSGHRVFKAKVAGLDCVYRSLTRKEFRDIQKKIADKTEAIRKASNQENVDTQLGLLKEEGEEELFIRAVLSPKVGSSLDLATLPAGVIPSISELIMEASGFGDEPVPEEL